MPKITYDTKDAVPEALREIAQEADGKFVIDVVPASFRDKNIELLRERDKMVGTLGKFKEVIGHEDVDKFVSEFGELRTTAQLVKDGKLTKKEEIEAEVARRTEAQKGSLEQQIRDAAKKAQEAEARANDYASKWKTTVVEQALTQAVMAEGSGANPAALPDILARGRQIFRVKEDGSLVAMQGDQMLYGADGESSMKPTEWLGKLLKEAAYLGKASAGGGATGNSSGKGTYGMSEDAWNKLSPQERLTRARAAQGGK